jgi:hypothetical protein
MGWTLVPIALFFAWLFLRSHPDCPDCGNRCSIIQSPLTKTTRQWIEGGFRCAHCGCESDRSGNKVVAGAALNPQSLYVAIGLLAATAIPAVVLLMTLLRS